MYPYTLAVGLDVDPPAASCAFGFYPPQSSIGNDLGAYIIFMMMIVIMIMNIITFLKLRDFGRSGNATFNLADLRLRV